MQDGSARSVCIGNLIGTCQVYIQMITPGLQGGDYLNPVSGVTFPPCNPGLEPGELLHPSSQLPVVDAEEPKKIPVILIAGSRYVDL